MPESVEDYQKRLEAEWNTYTAIGYCNVDGVLAAKPGDAIPASHPLVSEWLEGNLIAKNTTKAAKAATEKGIV